MSDLVRSRGKKLNNVHIVQCKDRSQLPLEGKVGGTKESGACEEVKTSLRIPLPLTVRSDLNLRSFLFDLGYSLTVRWHDFLLLAELRDDVADTGLALPLPYAVGDVFHAVQHLPR